MAFTTESVGNGKNILIAKEMDVTLPSSATTEHSSALPVEFDPEKEDNFVSIGVQASAVSGTNIDIHLYGDFEEGGTKVQLSADLVTALTDNTFDAGQIDLNENPARKYYVGWEADVDESANDIDVYVVG